jgi:predicted RNA-binding Zn ribbon-like protein
MERVEFGSGRTFDLSGGRLCLDFANTLGGKRESQPVERLSSYGDLVAFGYQAGILSARRARALIAQAESHPKMAAQVLRRARELREAIYQIWIAQLRNARPAERSMNVLNSALREALVHQRLVREGERLVLSWSDEDSLDSLLWPVAKSAADLLTSDEAALVRQCEEFSESECAWLFIDETRNRSRRWCSMASCGNRAKARRHYQRIRQGQAGPRS